jgi:hypothetical protein
MAPKAKAIAPTATVSTKKRERDQVNRRDIEKKTKRFMEEKVYGKVDLKVLETFRVDENLFEEAVRKWYEAGNSKINPPSRKRCSWPTAWQRMSSAPSLCLTEVQLPIA